MRINQEPHGTYASDRYAVLDIASNEEDASHETIDAEASGKDKLKDMILQRKNSAKAERDCKKREKERKAAGPVRVPAGQLTPRADGAKGAYRPEWVCSTFRFYFTTVKSQLLHCCVVIPMRMTVHYTGQTRRAPTRTQRGRRGGLGASLRPSGGVQRP